MRSSTSTVTLFTASNPHSMLTLRAFSPGVWLRLARPALVITCTPS